MPIHTETTPCWRIVLPTGEDYDMGEGVPHFDTEREATERIAEYEISGATVKPFGAPCAIVACDECEEDLSSEEFSRLHFDGGEAEARKAARESDWTVTEDGVVRCWDCPDPTNSEDDE